MRGCDDEKPALRKIDTAADSWKLTQADRSGDSPKIKEIVGKILGSVMVAANRGRSSINLNAYGDDGFPSADDEIRYAFDVLKSRGFQIEHSGCDPRESKDTSFWTISWMDAVEDDDPSFEFPRD